MKGIVFMGFLDMVEEKFGYDIVDEIILEGNFFLGGFYIFVGIYFYGEMV